LHRSGVKLGIVSNTEALLTQFELDRYPVLQTAQTIVLSSQVGIRKPNPEIFRLALDRVGGAPSSSVFIGNDWNAEVRGAQHAGLRVIYINDQAAEDVRLITGMGDVIESAPTLEAISSSLRVCGWLEKSA
jgi:FMN phosphatase YigB (HAD superfamily)